MSGTAAPVDAHSKTRPKSMALLEPKLSNIAGAGQGLFVTSISESCNPPPPSPTTSQIAIKKGEIITEYLGVSMTTRETMDARSRGDEMGYLMRLGAAGREKLLGLEEGDNTGDHDANDDGKNGGIIWLNAADPSRSSIARYINDPLSPLALNAEFVKCPSMTPPRALVVATRDIVLGEEVFCSYGKWYWQGGKGRKLGIKEIGGMYVGIEGGGPLSEDADACRRVFLA